MYTSIQLCHAVGLHWFHRADFEKLLSHIFERFLTTCWANDNETITYSYWIDKLLRHMMTVNVSIATYKQMQRMALCGLSLLRKEMV